MLERHEPFFLVVVDKFLKKIYSTEFGLEDGRRGSKEL